jgi:hypothetical protein
MVAVRLGHSRYDSVLELEQATTPNQGPTRSHQVDKYRRRQHITTNLSAHQHMR